MNGSERERLTEAADHLDWLYEGSKHIPTDLFHDRDFRMGLIREGNPDITDVTNLHPVAQFFYGGAAEVFLALGPAALPLLSALLRQVAAGDSTDGTSAAALTLADHILKGK